MFGNLFNADTSNLQVQRLDLNRSANSIPKTLSADGYRPINGYDHINNNLAEELSQLSINPSSLAPYDCPIDPSALSIPMLTRSQGNILTLAYTLTIPRGGMPTVKREGRLGGRTTHHNLRS
jgi:hypothetical protein